jgi:hypothetical protein
VKDVAAGVLAGEVGSPAFPPAIWPFGGAVEVDPPTFPPLYRLFCGAVAVDPPPFPPPYWPF